MNNKKNILEINFWIFILLVLSLITFLNDYVTYFFNLNYIISLIISSVIVLGILYIVKKHLKINNKFDKFDFVFFIILALIFLLQIPYPDADFDTLNYHLYNQEKPFFDKIFYDFFPGRCINSFTYAYSDRLFYIFRFILGYRLGTSLNILLMIIIYYITKDLLLDYTKSKYKWIICIASSLITCSLTIVSAVNTYYVDVLSATNLYILFYYAMRHNENNLYIYLVAFLSSISFITKLSNAFFILLFMFIYLINNYKLIKSLKIKQVIIFILCGLVPSFVYIFYTYKNTFNPVFPFFNGLFKSKYFFFYNWIDDGYGPKILYEYFIWPILSFFYPFRATDSGIVDLGWAYGYIVNVVYILVSLFRLKFKCKIDKRLFILNIIGFISYIIWIFNLLGYCRYSIFTLILGELCFYILIIKCFLSLLNKRHIKHILLFIIYVLIVFSSLFHFYIIYFGKTYSTIVDALWSEEYLNGYIYNIKHLFDRNEHVLDLPDNSVWLLFNNNAGTALQINKDVPIINYLDGSLSDDATKIMNDLMSKYQHFYVPLGNYDIELFCHLLGKSGWQIVDLVDIVKIESSTENSFIYVFEVSKSDIPTKFVTGFEANYKIDTKDIDYVEFKLIYSPYRLKDFKPKFNLTYVKDNVVVKSENYDPDSLMVHVKINTENCDQIIITSYNKISLISNHYYNYLIDLIKE